MMTEPRFKFDLQGLLRTAVMIATFIGGYYHMMGVLSERATANEQKIIAMEKRLDDHVKSVKVYSWEELNKSFVTREEWTVNRNELRDDLKYIRDRMDAIYNRVYTLK